MGKHGTTRRQTVRHHAGRTVTTVARNRLGSPDVGTGRQESLEENVDQYFKDLLEASSLGTPAASRIREATPGNVVDDVRRRLTKHTEDQKSAARAQHPAPGNARTAAVRPLFRRLDLHRIKSRLDDSACTDTGQAPLTASGWLLQDRQGDTSYDSEIAARANTGKGTLLAALLGDPVLLGRLSGSYGTKTAWDQAAQAVLRRHLNSYREFPMTGDFGWPLAVSPAGWNLPPLSALDQISRWRLVRRDRRDARTAERALTRLCFGSDIRNYLEWRPPLPFLPETFPADLDCFRWWHLAARSEAGNTEWLCDSADPAVQEFLQEFRRTSHWPYDPLQHLENDAPRTGNTSWLCALISSRLRADFANRQSGESLSRDIARDTARQPSDGCLAIKRYRDIDGASSPIREMVLIADNLDYPACLSPVFIDELDRIRLWTPGAPGTVRPVHDIDPLHSLLVRARLAPLDDTLLLLSQPPRLVTQFRHEAAFPHGEKEPARLESAALAGAFLGKRTSFLPSRSDSRNNLSSGHLAGVSEPHR